MTEKTLAEVAEKMRGIDLAMLCTNTADGGIASRPMSNNGDVDYDGDSYYFANGTAHLVAEIERDANVTLAFARPPGLLTGAPLFISVAGSAHLIRDKAAFAEHWNTDLDAWFEQGIDTPGLVMVKVHAARIKYWHGEDQGEVLV
jgi:general stress protein 26